MRVSRRNTQLVKCIFPLSSRMPQVLTSERDGLEAEDKAVDAVNIRSMAKIVKEKGRAFTGSGIESDDCGPARIYEYLLS